MKKYLQLMVVAVAVGMLGLCTTAVADIPVGMDYHATLVHGGGWSGHMPYGEPKWKEFGTADYGFEVPNDPRPYPWYKEVWFEIEWPAGSAPDVAPAIWISAPDGVEISPNPYDTPVRNVVNPDVAPGWTWHWILTPQPEWERIHMLEVMSGDYAQIEVGTRCIPEPGTVSLLVIGSLVLGIVAVIRRKK